jgi:hypothetical protein
VGPAIRARRWEDDPRAYNEPVVPVVGLDVYLDYCWRDRCQYTDPVWEVRLSLREMSTRLAKKWLDRH